MATTPARRGRILKYVRVQVAYLRIYDERAIFPDLDDVARTSPGLPAFAREYGPELARDACSDWDTPTSERVRSWVEALLTGVVA